MTEGALLSVQGLQAWYGESHVLHGVDLEVREGETVTLLGRNGAGKTTTLRAIMGIVRKREGTIRLRGQDLMPLALHQVARRGLGYVPEERGIFASLDVEENLLLPPTVAEGGVSARGDLSALSQSRGAPHEPGHQALGRRAADAGDRPHPPDGARMLLLDEPTEGLAPVIVQRIGEVIRALKERGMTILLVEQNFRFARRVADRFYVMEDGRMIDGFPASQIEARMDFLHDTLGV